MLRFAFIVWCCAAAPLLAAQNPCAACHPAETKLHERTRMAHAMSPALSSQFAKHVSDHPLWESAKGYSFSYAPTAGGLAVTVERGKKSAEAVMEWVLGDASQAETPMLRVGNAWYESRLSYFSRANAFGITVDQPAGNSRNANAALGLKENDKDAKSCFNCHSTGGLTDDLEPVIPGVQCERCHAGANEHARTKGPVVNPGKLSPRGQIGVCGACHRVTPPVDDKQLENVRFQPLRLIKSKCFASGKLYCTTCHPAHMDARANDPAFYNERCHTCHDAQGARQHIDARRTADCIGCHMPAVQVHQALDFTDHYIRTVGKNDEVAPFLRPVSEGR